jgi:hypothetical protein
MTSPDPHPDERVAIPLDPEEALRALLQVDPDSDPMTDENSPCPKEWNGKRCKLEAAHFGPCQYDV